MIEVSIDTRDIEAALLEMKTASAKTIARKVMRKSGQPVADVANRLAPKGGKSKDGALNTSYGVGTRLTKRQRGLHRKNDPDDVEVFIGTKDTAGVVQEIGTVHHGAQPHLRPAWHRERDGVLDSMIDGLEVEIEKAAARARRKAAR